MFDYHFFFCTFVVESIFPMSNFGPFLMILFCLCIDESFKLNLSHELIGIIGSYGICFERLLLGKCVAQIQSVSKVISYNLCSNAEQIIFDTKQYVLRQMALDVVYKTRKRIILDMNRSITFIMSENSEDIHYDRFWRYYVLYYKNRMRYSEIIDVLLFDEEKYTLTLKTFCTLKLVSCIQNNIELTVNFDDNMTQKQANIALKDDPFDSIVINIGVNQYFDVNQIHLSPKTRLVIYGYDLEYKDNRLFPSIIIHRELKIICIVPKNDHILFDLSNVIFDDNDIVMDVNEYGSIGGIILGDKGVHKQSHRKYVNVKLPLTCDIISQTPGSHTYWFTKPFHNFNGILWLDHNNSFFDM